MLHNTIRNALFVLGVFLLSAGTLTAGALAQSTAPFSNASLQGTYVISFLSDDDVHTAKRILTLLTYADGEGNFRNVRMLDHWPGEPDADGNPTRDIRTTVADSGTWVWANPNTYSVTYGGFFTWGTRDAFPTRVELIDGVVTIVEWTMSGTSYNSFNRIPLGRAYRISGEDLLPPAP